MSIPRKATANQRSQCCAVDFLRSSLFLYQVVFLLSGATLLALGIYTVVEKNTYSTLISSWYTLATYGITATGIFAIGAGVLGCYGTIGEKSGPLVMFSVMLVVVLVLEIVTGASAYLMQHQLKDEVRENLSERMVKGWNSDEATTKAIDSLHQLFQCCGAHTYKEWRQSHYAHLLNISTPDSCCKTLKQYCGMSDHPSNIYQEGCALKLFNHLHANLIIIGAVALGFCLMQIFGITLSCFLAQQLKIDRKERQRLAAI